MAWRDGVRVRCRLPQRTPFYAAFRGDRLKGMLCGNPILWPLAIRLTAMAARVGSPKSSHGVTQDRAGGQVFRNGMATGHRSTIGTLHSSISSRSSFVALEIELAVSSRRTSQVQVT